MSALNLIFGQTFNTTNKLLVATFDYNAATRNDWRILNVTVKILLLAFFQFFFFRLNLIAFLIELLLSYQEAVFCVFICSGETVKDVTAISAIILYKFLTEQSI